MPTPNDAIVALSRNGNQQSKGMGKFGTALHTPPGFFERELREGAVGFGEDSGNMIVFE
jgi:hypothetical protein